MKKQLIDGGLSVLDQGINSFSSFIILAIVARALSPADTGNYSIIFTTIILLGGIQNSLIIGPLRIYGVKDNLKSKYSYLKSQFELQLYCSGILAVILAIILEFIPGITFLIIIAASFSLFSIQIHEFVRAYYLTNLEFKPLILNDILVHGTRIIILTIVWLTGIATVDRVYSVVAISGVLTFFIFNMYKKSLDGEKHIKLTVVENWKFGRWVLMETIAFSISINFYIYLIAYILTPDKVAGFNVVQNILNIQNIIVIGVTSYVITSSRKKLINEGYNEWKRFLIVIGSLLFVFSIVVVVIFSMNGSWILGTVYGEYYTKFSYLIPILGVAYPLLVLTTILSVAFRTAELPEVGLFAKIFSAIFTIIFSTLLLKGWGVKGAAYGIVLTQICWLLVYIYFVFKGSLSKYNIRIINGNNDIVK